MPLPVTLPFYNQTTDGALERLSAFLFWGLEKGERKKIKDNKKGTSSSTNSHALLEKGHAKRSDCFLGNLKTLAARKVLSLPVFRYRPTFISRLPSGFQLSKSDHPARERLTLQGAPARGETCRAALPARALLSWEASIGFVSWRKVPDSSPYRNSWTWKTASINGKPNGTQSNTCGALKTKQHRKAHKPDSSGDKC